jgi:transposase
MLSYRIAEPVRWARDRDPEGTGLDGDGHTDSLSATAATAANVNGTLVLKRLFLAAFAVMARIRSVFADKGHDAEHHRTLCRAFDVDPFIYTRGQPQESGSGQRRWPVERSLSWLLENKRLGLRYDRCGFVIQSLLQTDAWFWLQPASLGNSETAS